jgi:hypothetical protein
MNSTIKTILKVFAILLFLAGLTFFLQGINVLPGSYMTGDPQWAVNGSIVMVVSIGLFWFANRK